MEYYVVAILLASPWEIPLPRNLPQPYWTALIKHAEFLQVAGPGAMWLVSDFRQEVRWTRRCYKEAEGCPSVSDCDYLPSSDECGRIRQRWEIFLRYLHAADRERLHWQAFLEDPIKEAEKTVEFWRCAKEARETGPHVFWYARRKALGYLRDFVGEEAYSNHEWPAAFPPTFVR